MLQPRAEEVFHSVWDELHRAGYEKSLNSGLVLTGGGANLTYIFVNARYRVSRWLEFQGLYHRGLSIDTRTITPFGDGQLLRQVNMHAIVTQRANDDEVKALWDMTTKTAAKLMRKELVLSTTTSWVFRAGPPLTLACVALAGLLVPVGRFPAPIFFTGSHFSPGFALRAG